MNWIKKKMEQLSARLNADEEAVVKPTEREPIDLIQAGDTPSSHEPAQPVNQYLNEKKPDNIEELKEITMGAITQSVRMLGYGKAIVSGLKFHSRFAPHAVENIGLMTLVNDKDFVKRIMRDFKSKGIKYNDDLVMKVYHESEFVNKVTKIIDGIGVEILTPQETLKSLKARLVATEGVTWEPEYLLEPTAKHYYIGRCKDPKIENGPKIHNDVAFVGIEERDEERFKINNYISRSHAVIVFDETVGAYKIYRSKFLNNPSHKIKIYNSRLNDFNGISLNQATVPHVLKDGDSITFNDKIVLEFFLITE